MEIYLYTSTLFDSGSFKAICDVVLSPLLVTNSSSDRLRVICSRFIGNICLFNGIKMIILVEGNGGVTQLKRVASGFTL